jgi:hypothetical protein
MLDKLTIPSSNGETKAGEREQFNEPRILNKENKKSSKYIEVKEDWPICVMEIFQSCVKVFGLILFICSFLMMLVLVTIYGYGYDEIINTVFRHIAFAVFGFSLLISISMSAILRANRFSAIIESMHLPYITVLSLFLLSGVFLHPPNLILILHDIMPETSWTKEILYILQRLHNVLKEQEGTGLVELLPKMVITVQVCYLGIAYFIPSPNFGFRASNIVSWIPHLAVIIADNIFGLISGMMYATLRFTRAILSLAALNKQQSNYRRDMKRQYRAGLLDPRILEFNGWQTCLESIKENRDVLRKFILAEYFKTNDNGSLNIYKEKLGNKAYGAVCQWVQAIIHCNGGMKLNQEISITDDKITIGKNIRELAVRSLFSIIQNEEEHL